MLESDFPFPTLLARSNSLKVVLHLYQIAYPLRGHATILKKNNEKQATRAYLPCCCNKKVQRTVNLSLSSIALCITLLQASGGGLKLPNGTWTGVMGYLTRKEVDLAAFPLSLTPIRATLIDYTPPFLTEGYAILKRKEESISDFRTFLQPFTSSTWLALLGALLVSGILMFSLDRITGIARRRANGHHLVDEAVRKSPDCITHSFDYAVA
jgi:hypothetical protein